MASIKDIVSGLQDQHGDRIGGFNAPFLNVPRLPSGVFAFDLATGGGFPLGMISTVYGSQSCGKTSLVLKTVGEFQRRYPGMKAVYVDAEGTTTEQFATFYGVSWKDLVYLRPTHGEQAVDFAQAAARADDVGLIVADSVAHITSTGLAEMEAEGEKDLPGRAGLLGRKLYNKLHHEMLKADKQGRVLTFIGVNQPRTQIGVVYGNPERLPGGTAQLFHSALIVRLWGKHIMDTKAHATLPALRETKGRLTKWKYPIIGEAFEYSLVLQPHKNLKPGECDDWQLIRGFLMDMGELKKQGAQYVVLGEKFTTQAGVRERFYADLAYADKIRAAVLVHMVGGKGVVAPKDTDTGTVVEPEV